MPSQSRWRGAMVERGDKRTWGGGSIPPPLKHRSTLFSRQPLLFLAAALAAGAALGYDYRIKGGGLLLLGVAAAALGIACVLWQRRGRGGWAALTAMGAFMLGGMLLTAAAVPDWAGLWEESGVYTRVTGRVSARQSGATADTLLLDGLIVEDDRGVRSLDGKLALTVGAAREDERMETSQPRQGWQRARAEILRVGDRLLLDGITLTLPADPELEGAFNGRAYWLAQGVRFTAYASENNLLYQEGGGFTRWLDGFRQWLDGRLTEDLGARGAGLARALLLGRTGDMDGERAAYSNLGIVHVLSVSGLHVSLLMAAADWVARKYRWPMVPRALLQWALIGIYYLLVGVIPSFNRVLLMAAIPLAARMLCRESDPVNTLSLAFCLQLAMTPLAIFSTSLQLTYLATLAMLLLGGDLLKRPVTGGILLSLAIAWVIMPFALSPGYPVAVGLANILLTPVFSLLVIGCFLYLPLAAIGPLTAGYGNLLGRLCAGTQTLVTEIGLHFPLLRIPFQGAWGLAAVSAGLVLVSSPRLLGKSRRLRAGVLAAAAAVMLTAVMQTQSQRTVHATALFSGTHTALWLEDGGSALITADSDGLTDAADVMSVSRRGRAEMLIYTGTTADELERVLATVGDLGVKKLFLTGFSDYQLSGWLQRLADAYGVEAGYLLPGESLMLGGFSLESVPGGLKVKRGGWTLAYGAATGPADVWVVPALQGAALSGEEGLTVFACPYRAAGLDGRAQNLYNNARNGAWRRIWPAGGEE